MQRGRAGGELTDEGYGAVNERTEMTASGRAA